ncbi:MAG: hypothetical protein Kow0088_18010 [Anaerolineales bacterium]
MQSLIIQNFKLFAPLQLGKKDTWAHLDTGASGNMITATEAQALESIEKRVLQAGIGQQDVKQVRLSSLQFLGKRFDDTTAIVFDGDSYFGEVPFQISMTLGEDVLLAEPLVLDFKRLWVGYAKRHLREDLPSFALDCTSGLPFINLGWGQRELSTIFDTGASYCILNAAHLQELSALPPQVYALEVRDPAGGQGEMPIYRLENLSIGEIRLGRCEAFIVNLEPVEQRLKKRIDFVLGANLMLTSALVWVLDKEHGRTLVSERDVNVYA